MRRVMVCIWVLVASATLLHADPLPLATLAGGNQKVINDPAEYNAYLNALNTEDPLERAAAMEAFFAHYPNSVMKEDALEQALAAYQAAGKLSQAEKVARKILDVNENDVRALALVVFVMRDSLTRGQHDVKPGDLRILAERGLRALPEWENPPGLAENDFEKLLEQLKIVFHGAAGFAALQEKDYTAARDFYTPAVALDPNDLTNTYQLGVADLEMKDPDVRGFWYVARAIHLCGPQNVTCEKMITNYGLAKYRKYHGSEEGWARILEQTAKMVSPPRDFNVPHGAQPGAGLSGTSASLTSNSSPGSTHSVPASALSSNRTSGGGEWLGQGQPAGPPASVLSANTDGTAHATSASVLSTGTPGNAHNVPASVLSANSLGTAHNVSASATSSTTVRAGNANRPVSASVLHAAGASAAAVRRAMISLKNALGGAQSTAAR